LYSCENGINKEITSISREGGEKQMRDKEEGGEKRRIQR
jgi:hypothetical protein